MRIVAVSDIHLETRQEIPEIFQDWDIDADILILAGDIGCPFKRLTRDFLDMMSPLFKYIIYVSGNHEYYSGNPVPKCDKQLRKLCEKFENVIYLNNRTFNYGGIKFIGSPLWSYIPEGDHFPNTGDGTSINGMTQTLKNKMFFENVHFLTKEIESSKEMGEDIIVITHHLPTYKAIAPQHKDYPRNYYYASHLDHLLPGCNAWVHGHSHSHLKLTVKGCLLYRNPVGYYDENWVFVYECFDI